MLPLVLGRGTWPIGTLFHILLIFLGLSNWVPNCFRAGLEIMCGTWMVLPVSGVIPSMVRIISNCIFDEMSRAENSYNGDSSSAN